MPSDRQEARSAAQPFTVKWGPDMPVAGNGWGARDLHYVMFRGKWRHVPRIIQRAWERVIPKLFGSCATSTIKANGYWVGSIR